MTQIPNLFDHQLLRARQSRIQTDALFLHDLAVSEIRDRLNEVNKSFSSPLIITRHTDYWAGEFSYDTHEFAENLHLAEQSYDLIIHAMSLHWANDPVGQLIQMRRALKPDGLMLLACFGGQTLSTLRQAIATVEMAHLGGLSPRIAPMADLRDLGDLLGRAGFALPVSDRINQNVSYRDVVQLVHDLRAMGESNAMLDRHKKLLSRDFFTALHQAYPKNSTDRISVGFELVMLAGWSPDPSQQQPLRPGSASQRLADALNTSETSLNND